MQSQRIELAGPAGKLQALYSKPSLEPKVAVVLCHPHPLYGGTMQNKVVYWLARVFEAQGCAVLRFNFRGVGNSQGSWDEGAGESRDVLAALNALAEKHPKAELWLAGFSFGAYAAALASVIDQRVQHLFAIAPAVNHWSFDFLASWDKPVHVFQGCDDEIVPAEQVFAWAERMPNMNLHRFEGAGHFFPNHAEALQEALRSRIQPLLAEF